jgi:hypothetical protein
MSQSAGVADIFVDGRAILQGNLQRPDRIPAFRGIGVEFYPAAWVGVPPEFILAWRESSEVHRIDAVS